MMRFILFLGTGLLAYLAAIGLRKVVVEGYVDLPVLVGMLALSLTVWVVQLVDDWFATRKAEVIMQQREAWRYHRAAGPIERGALVILGADGRVTMCSLPDSKVQI